MNDLLILTQNLEQLGLVDKLRNENVNTNITTEIKNQYPIQTKVGYNWRNYIRTHGHVFSTSDRHGRLCEDLRSRGYNILGGIRSNFQPQVIDQNKQYITIGRLYHNHTLKGPNIISIPYTRFLNNNKGTYTFMGEVCFLRSKLKYNYTQHLLEYIENQSLAEGTTDTIGFIFGVYAFDTIENDLVLQNIFTSPPETLLYTLMEHFKHGYKKVFTDLFKGIFPQYHHNKISLGALLTEPPFPYAFNIYPELDINENALKHLFKFPGGYYITAIGENISEARRRLYRSIDMFTTSSTTQYRDDIGLGFHNLMRIFDGS